MRRKVFPAGSALWIGVLAVLLFVSAAPGQTASLASSRSTEVGTLLERGRQLEIERRWGEALSHYEEAVRHFPGELSLERRFEFARLHYDLGRRYSDDSYRAVLARLSLSEALDLYSEVLLKIQSHHVDDVHWKEIVERGTNSLEVALSEATFLSWHASQVDAPTVDQFRYELRRRLGSQVIQTRADARAVVALVADLARQRLGLEPTATVLEYTCGATNSLDPYSSYLTPNQLNEVYSQIEGNFVGLGIELKADDGALLIVRVIPNSPAEQGGILAGDKILAVDGQLTNELSTDQAANLLQGEAGSQVNLRVVSPGQSPRPIEVRRRRVEVPSIDSVSILDPALGIGYLKLTCFQKTTSHDLDNALWKLHRAGMRSLIMDLRGNPGGLLVSSVEVADKFVDSGVIVSTHGRSVQEDFTYSAHQTGTWRVPLVVLIDQDSASAAEIFAGAIRDHRRGTIVGKRSYGKGSVQGIFPLNLTNAGIRLTTAKFYSPNGRPYSGVGVEPDIAVQQVARPIDNQVELTAANDDPVLAAARQAALQSMAQR